MDYVPSSDQELEQMLKDSGSPSFEEIVACIPESLRNQTLELEPGISEMELNRRVTGMAQQNMHLGQLISFLGGGAYEHYIPAAIDHVSMRSEFYTAYTPYQAEASQGTLQAIYEYQSLICQLTGMDVSNASLYDGASATAEAAVLALNIQRNRNVILAADTLHPDYLATICTYLEGLDCEFHTVPTRDGAVSAEHLTEMLDDRVAAVLVQSPNFHGCIEDMPNLSQQIHDKGAFLIAVVNPISLGLLKPPGEYGADFAVGEGQPLGIPISYGGPYLGFLTCSQKLVHRVSGRLVGCSIDSTGAPGFCLTLQAREQHIRREKATSNICTNQSLMALRAAIYLSLLGPEGLREVADTNYRNAHLLHESICQINGFDAAYDKAFFNEFTVKTPLPAEELCQELEDQGILAGLPLSRFGGDSHEMLVCATETKTESDFERYLKALKQVADRHRGKSIGVDQ